MGQVVCAVIKQNIAGKEKYLLVKVKKDFGKYTGFLQPVGGHVESGENEKDALRREIHVELE
ncbi:MAG: NUDIX domain-containing protein [Patescibacteria group bacterium]